MRKTALSLAAAALLCLASTAQGQATRTWVSGVGNDANPCSRTAPCKTFAGALSKTAAGGEINVLDPGGFGTLTITKSITIINDSAIGGVLASGTNGIVISAGVNDVVTLRGLDINGLGPTSSSPQGLNGVRFLSGKGLHVQNCRIYGFAQQGIDFEPNSLGSQLEVQGTYISENTAKGILVKPAVGGSAKVALDQVHLVNNADGFKADATNGAIQATVRESVATGNSGAGFHAFSPGANVAAVLIDHAAAVNNGTGIFSDTGAGSTIRITDMTVTGNGTGLSFTGSAKISSFGNNHNNGNATEGAPSPGLLPVQ
jgi:hypothetical protein